MNHHSRTGVFVLAALLASFASLHARAQTFTSLPRADGAAIPVAIYAPAGGQACASTLLLSHGFGGDEKGLSGLANAFAARGWRVIAMGHRESGWPQLRAAFARGGGLADVDAAARDKASHAARFADVDAAYREATRPCRPPQLVLAGHSMGAQTTMMEAGAVPRIGGMGSNRFDAYIALSPQGVGTAFAPGAWSGVSKPVLMVTGTNDRVFDSDYTARLTAFAGLPTGRKRLAVIPGAGHLQIGGIGSGAVSAIVQALALEFAGQASGSWGPSQVTGAKITDK